jgi:thioredoxin 1
MAPVSTTRTNTCMACNLFIDYSYIPNTQFIISLFNWLLANNIMLFSRYHTQGSFMSDKITHVNNDTFDSEVLQSQLPVLVDYWAEWCGPCKMIAPALDESADNYAGRVRVAKVNVDENQSLASRYHVRGIPTLMLFKGGEVVATKIGAVSKAQLAAFIDANL